MAAHVLDDCFEITLTPVLALKPLFLLRDGVFTPFERALRQGLQPQHVATSRDKGELQRLLALHDLGSYSFIESTANTRPVELIGRIGERIAADAALLSSDYGHSTQARLEGDAARLYIHYTAQISPHAVIDTTEGAVVIDEGAKIAALSFIKGPAYIGRRTQLDQCRLANSIAGENCRLGGEIADSIIGNFSNKHHDGFLGHSIVGDWVNLGALTTTSDLKNNYGEVRLHYAGAVFPTGTIKFGAIIGDYAKTAIGTLLGTGTIVGLGANLFGEARWSGHVAAFAWGSLHSYDRERFLRDAERMMQRRGQSISLELRAVLREL